jgi:hypothetical protein
MGVLGVVEVLPLPFIGIFAEELRHGSRTFLLVGHPSIHRNQINQHLNGAGKTFVGR